VHKNQIKNIFLFFSVKAILLYFLLTASLITQAQNDSVSDVADELQINEEAIQDTSGLNEDNKELLHFTIKATTDTLKVTQRYIPLSAVKSLKEDEDFWYANNYIEKKSKKGSEEPVYIPIAKRNWFQTVLWLIIIGVFASAIAWYLASSNVGLFRKKSTNEIMQEDEVMPEDIFAINYLKEIDKATSQGNYRLAVRLMFLKGLKKMAEKNIIQYKQDKTNLDYLLQLQQSSYYTGFFRVTRNYEYCWYGMFEINEEAFKKISHDFDLFEKHLNN